MISTIPAREVKNSIVYLSLLSILPEDKLKDFKRSVLPLFNGSFPQGKGKKISSMERSLPDACFRIVAFHQAKREPDAAVVNSLLKVAMLADKNAKSLKAFQDQMKIIFASAGRAKLENRLHRNKGCRYCALPCHFGFFSLVTDPDFPRLLQFLSAEAKKPVSSQTPLIPAYLFAIEHLMRLTGSQDTFFEKDQVANLAYCLLLLGLAKSRLAFPEAQIKLFQNANQLFIQR